MPLFASGGLGLGLKNLVLFTSLVFSEEYGKPCTRSVLDSFDMSSKIEVKYGVKNHKVVAIIVVYFLSV